MTTTISLDKIEQSVLASIEAANVNCLKNGVGTSDWTTSFKKALCSVGTQFGFSTCASGVDDAESEWLYDVTWYEYDQKDRLVSIPFAAEIEWRHGGLHGVKFDFEKLVQSTADHKVMIFEAKDVAEAKAWTSELKRYVHCYRPKMTQDRYFFLSYDWESNEIFHDQLLR
ncbi:hypothetical protein [Oceanococcus atlanticus]|uniref:hypothetical protein n=1 Tax=Oceanococcus atlanticus TaxID=1317117 RepID=UPI0011BA759B|nr:hypothetical protein [Oceanococcus atlanticus]